MSAALSGSQHFPRPQNDRVIGNAKMRIQSLGRTRVTESGHAYEMRAVLDIAFPAESTRCFNREARRAGVLKVGSGNANQAAAYATGMAYWKGLDQMMVKAADTDM